MRRFESSTRRAVLGGLGALGLLGCTPVRGRTCATAPAPTNDLIWGVNGHPFTAYPGISLAAQLDLARSLGLTQYRVNTRGDGSPDGLDALIDLACERGMTILPILEPEGDLATESAAEAHDKAFALGRAMAERFADRIHVWELANELESFAIIEPCEMRDDGTQYPCEWGPAGGVEALDYVGARWAKVSAVLAGLSEGVAAGNASARRAIGSAGWGHLGAFERLTADGVAWDITVWHDYEGIREEYLATLAGYGKPIWITEFNGGAGGAGTPEENAAKLTDRIAYYRRMREPYGVEAAFVYELLDEPYWGGDFEARMGLVGLDPAGDSWRVGDLKPAAEAVRTAIAAAP